MKRAQDCDVFISYFRGPTKTIAGVVYTELRDALPTLRIFRDEEGMGVGPWSRQLERNLRSCRFFVLIISPAWQKPEIQQRLRDPNEWVPREIRTVAGQSATTVIPLLVEGASKPSGLPEDIQQVIDRNQWLNIGTSTTDWKRDIEKVAVHIAGEQSSHSRRAAEAELFCDLDRHQEAPLVRASVLGSHQALVVRGNRHDEPGLFAHRCGWEINRDTRATESFGRPAPINWRRFAMNSNAELRETDLLREIAGASNVADSNQVKAALTRHFRESEQTLVYYTLAEGQGPDTAERIREWQHIWRELLAKQRRRAAVALLFLPYRWLFPLRCPLPTAATDDIDRLQRAGLSHVQSEDVEAFVRDLADKGKLTDDQCQQAESACTRLYRWPLRRRMKHVKQALMPVIMP